VTRRVVHKYVTKFNYPCHLCKDGPSIPFPDGCCSRDWSRVTCKKCLKLRLPLPRRKMGKRALTLLILMGLCAGVVISSCCAKCPRCPQSQPIVITENKDTGMEEAAVRAAHQTDCELKDDLLKFGIVVKGCDK
jgi:hypothetical protein